MRNAFWFFGAVVLCACGPSGTLNGKVEVQGGSAAGVAVIAYGPVSGAAVTGDDGAFSFGSLPDGKYVVRAQVANVDPDTQSASATLTAGKQDADILLTFKAANAKVTGKVRFTDASSPDALTVTAAGTETRSVRTTADGSFVFDGLKTGAYVLTVEVAGTREGRVSIGVSAVGAVDAGELVLTPVGTVSGTVTFAAMPAAGVSVTIPGTNLGTVTDAAGAFALSDVPAGMQNVRAQSGIEPFFRSATAMLVVKRGANDPLALVLTDDAPKTGIVTGIVTFRGARSPRDITVSVRGTSVTASPGNNGLFTLAAPIGEWDIVASAPQHPALVLGRVLVSEGSTQSLPGRELSWYRPLFTSASTITNVSSVSGTAPTNPWAIGALTDGVGTRTFVVNAQTGELRFIFVGAMTQSTVSSNGKYVAWVASSSVYTYELATGAMNRFYKPNFVELLQFSTDESVLFIQRSGRTLTRIPLATPTMQTIFPATGTATSISFQNPDRWFVSNGGITYDLVGTSVAGDAASIFTNVSSFNLVPTAWALTDCSGGANCALRVLGPASMTVQTDSNVLPTAGSIGAFTSSGVRSTGAYPCFSTPSASFCVKAADGTHFPLPASPIRFLVNVDGTRVLSAYNIGGTYSVREEAMPPGTATTALASSTDPFSVDWLSTDRAYAYRQSGATRELRLIKGGMVTLTDTDIGSSIYLLPPLIVLQRASVMKWSVLLGDGPFRDAETTSSSIYNLATRGYVAGAGWPRQAVVSFEQNDLTVIDEAAGALKTVNGAYISSAAGRSSNAEIFVVGRPGGNQALYAHNTAALLESEDASGDRLGFVGSVSGAFGQLGLSRDGYTLLLGTFAP